MCIKNYIFTLITNVNELYKYDMLLKELISSVQSSKLRVSYLKKNH